MRVSRPYFGGNVTPGVKLIMKCTIIVFIIQVFATKMNISQVEDYFALKPRNAIENFWIWQFFTHGFMHSVGSYWHIFFNMLSLYFFGHIVERHYGTRKFYICYITCMVIAAIVHSIDAYIYKSSGIPALGASGAVMGILAISACLLPDTIVYLMFAIPLRLRTLIWLLVSFELYNAIMHPNSSVSAAAHLGGIGAGYLFFRYGQRVMSWMDNLEMQMERQDKKQQQKKYKNVRSKVDELLDKISDGGIHSLSEKEKDFLKKASKKYKDD
ncbi:rhomboid family intramembrane serine protease [Candidatus Uabimicrobium sp. HlEnr_7]|uniref:rhomboid family intramembrane serine protease n=1 Tax=Candidatus Uabimicrobium helgolandensis TaxID=3095367 RepID=UPI003558D428